MNRACRDCTAPIGPRAQFCTACAHQRRRASMYRYTQKPSTKLARAAYVASIPEHVRIYKLRYKAKQHVAGQIRQCATVRCDQTFILLPKSGPRKFCTTCQRAFFGRAYVRQQRVTA